MNTITIGADTNILAGAAELKVKY